MALDANLKTINILKHFGESIAWLQKGGYAMKSFDLLASRFRKAIIVDAEVLVLQNPEICSKLAPSSKTENNYSGTTELSPGPEIQIDGIG